jgi:hypothetical protein
VESNQTGIGTEDSPEEIRRGLFGSSTPVIVLAFLIILILVISTIYILRSRSSKYN